MCELLGLAFNRPVSPGLSFRGFRHRARGNPHGWGIAAISPRGTRIHKEPIDAETSGVATELLERDPLHAPLFIGHVRRASEGVKSLANTHPFARPLGPGTLCLAHNGTLTDMRKLRALAGPAFTPTGQTDSELVLGAILAWIDRRRAAASAAPGAPAADPLGDYAALEDFLREVNDLGDLNLLFSDGRRLYCYHDATCSNGLAWTRREAPFSRVSLRDEEWEVALDEEKARGQRGYVIASHPLTDGEEWMPCGHGRLLVIEHGEAVYGADPA